VGKRRQAAALQIKPLPENVAERRRKLASYEVAGDDAKNNLSQRDNGKPAGDSAVLSGRNFNLPPTRHFVSG
jgi:hypothetical protein